MPSNPVNAAYSIDRETVSWMGLDITAGISEGDGTVTEAAEGAQGWSQKSNGVGGAVQSFNPSTRGTLTIKIDMEHPLHLALKRLVQLDQLTRAICGPLDRTRPSGEKVKYGYARLVREPDESTGTMPGVAEWQWIYANRSSALPDPQLNILIPISTPPA